VAVPVVEAAPVGPPRDVLADMRFAYRPIWDRTRNAIATYLCIAQVPIAEAASALCDAELLIVDDVNQLRRLDSAVQRRVLDNFAELIVEKRRLLITLPVHFESLGHAAWRRNYLAEMTQLDAEARKLLMVEIVGLPRGVLQSRLLDLVAPLRQLCRGVMLRLSLETIDLSQVKGCGAAAVGCDLTGHPEPEGVLVQQMNRFARATQRVSMPSYVHGAQTLGLVTAALGAGFNYIDGDAVAKLVDHPRHVAELSSGADLVPVAVPVAEAATAPPPAAAPVGPPRDVLADMRFAYRPIWDRTRNAIVTYLCIAQVPIADAASALSDAELMIVDDVNQLRRLDSAVQRCVLDNFAELIVEKRRLLITLPAHFESLGHAAWRRNYLAEITRLDAEARKLLMVEIVGLPRGVLQSRLLDLVAPLRQLCRGVMLRLSLETIDLSQVKGCGAAAIGCDLSGHPGPESVLVQQMGRFARAAERVSMPSYVHGAQTLSLVTAALGAGFNYIDGDAVAKLVDHPRQVAEFRLADLYGVVSTT
jgi:hypothetical protein